MVEEAGRATIVGAGGIGCALGHALRTGGIGVTVVEADPEKVEWGRRHGLVVDDAAPQRVDFVRFSDWLPVPDDVVILCTKCYDNGPVLDRLEVPVELVPVQNGFDDRLGGRHELEGIASFVSECIPGRTHTRITRPGELHVGFSRAASGRPLPVRVEELIRVLERHGRFSVVRVEGVLPYKNTKLLYNAAISPLASMAGLDNGELLTIGAARRLFFALIRENYQILRGAGAELARIGPFHPDTVYRILRLPLLARLLAVLFARSLRGTYCSMAGDLGNGPTELDNYNGYLLKLAGDRHFPLNTRIYAAVKRMETEHLAPGLRRLQLL